MLLNTKVKRTQIEGIPNMNIEDRLTQLNSILDSNYDVDFLLDALVSLYQGIQSSVSDKFMTNFSKEHKELITAIERKRYNRKDFKVITPIAQGQFGTVSLVSCLLDGKTYALKQLSKNYISKNTSACIKQEREVLIMGKKSPWFPKLLCAFQDKENIFFVMEFLSGGDLFSLLTKQNEPVLPEKEAKFYIAEILMAINDLHKFGYLHRDMKPQNILFCKNGHIRLADFGSAIKLDPETNSVVSDIPVGTLDYCSPEVLKSQISKKPYGPSSDWWSLGILLYEILQGDPPFYSESMIETNSRITGKKNFEFSDEYPISDEAKDLIKKLLTEPEIRLGSGPTGVEEIKSHPFFVGIDFDNLLNQTAPIIPIVKDDKDTSCFVEFEEYDNNELDISMLKYNGVFTSNHLPFVGFSYQDNHKFGSSSSNNVISNAPQATSADHTECDKKIKSLSEDVETFKDKLNQEEKVQVELNKKLTKATEELKDKNAEVSETESLILHLEKEIEKLQVVANNSDSNKEIKELKDQLDSTLSELAALKLSSESNESSQLAELTSKLADVESKYNDLLVKNKELIESLTKCKDDLEELTKKSQLFEQQSQTTQEQLTKTQQENLEIQNKVDEAEKQISVIEKELSEIQKNNSKLQNELTQNEAEKLKLENLLLKADDKDKENTQSLQITIEKLKIANSSIQMQLDKALKETSKVEENLSNVEFEKFKYKSEFSKVYFEMQCIEKKKQASEIKAQELISKLEAEKSNFTAQLSSLEQQNYELNKKINELKLESDIINNKVKMVEQEKGDLVQLSNFENNNQAKSIQSRLDQVNSEKDALQENMMRIKSQKKDLMMTLNNANKDKDILQTQLLLMQDDKEKTESTIEQLKEDKEIQQAQLIQIQEERKKIKKFLKRSKEQIKFSLDCSGLSKLSLPTQAKIEYFHLALNAQLKNEESSILSMIELLQNQLDNPITDIVPLIKDANTVRDEALNRTDRMIEINEKQSKLINSLVEKLNSIDLNHQATSISIHDSTSSKSEPFTFESNLNVSTSSKLVKDDLVSVLTQENEELKSQLKYKEEKMNEILNKIINKDNQTLTPNGSTKKKIGFFKKFNSHSDKNSEEDPKELNKVLLERILFLDAKIQQLDNHNEKLKSIIKKSLSSDGSISTTPNTINSLFMASTPNLIATYVDNSVHPDNQPFDSVEQGCFDIVPHRIELLDSFSRM